MTAPRRRRSPSCSPKSTELLDPQFIRDAQALEKPPFPGHEESWRRYTETGRDRTAAAYARFMEATYGISPDAQTLHAITGAMRDADQPLPSPLADLLGQLEQIVVGAEHATQAEH